VGAFPTETLLTSSAIDPLISALPIVTERVRFRSPFLLTVAALPLFNVRAALVLRELLAILCLSELLAILCLSDRLPILCRAELLAVRSLHGLLASLCTRPLRKRRLIDVAELGLVPLCTEIRGRKI